jgi:hypothetical protein
MLRAFHTWHRVIWYRGATLSEEPAEFKLFDCEAGGSRALQYLCIYLPNCIASHTKGP